MEAIECLKERRSIRNYKDEKVSRDLMKEILEITRYAPSWSNTQTARWTIVDDEKKIQSIGEKGVKGFSYNTKTIEQAPGLAILSYQIGKSGILEQYNLISDNPSKWESFDAGIACQTFCLACYAYGVGTCIFGVIDEDYLHTLLELPDNEEVAAVIVFGYPNKKAIAPTRLSVEEIARFK